MRRISQPSIRNPVGMPPVCQIIDLRKLPKESAQLRFSQLLRDEAATYLIKSDAPMNLMTVPPWQSIPLVQGPSAFHLVLTVACPPSLLAIQWEAEVSHLLSAYKPIVERAKGGQEDCLEMANTYRKKLMLHIQAQEAQHFPAVDAFLGERRFTRELGYEHQGLLAGLSTFPDLLRQILEGSATRKQIEKQELDLHHMLEHHLERESKGLIPILSLGVEESSRRMT